MTLQHWGPVLLSLKWQNAHCHQDKALEKASLSPTHLCKPFCDKIQKVTALGGSNSDCKDCNMYSKFRQGCKIIVQRSHLQLSSSWPDHRDLWPPTWPAFSSPSLQSTCSTSKAPSQPTSSFSQSSFTLPTPEDSEMQMRGTTIAQQCKQLVGLPHLYCCRFGKGAFSILRGSLRQKESNA